MPARTPGDGHARGGSAKLERAVILDSEQSAALREKLLTQLGNIISADLAAAWARDALSAKNSLTATDAKLVEDAFERRLSELPSSDAAASSNDDPSVPQIAAPQVVATSENAHAGEARGIDKSILTVATPSRYRNREHLRHRKNHPEDKCEQPSFGGMTFSWCRSMNRSLARGPRVMYEPPHTRANRSLGVAQIDRLAARRPPLATKGGG